MPCISEQPARGHRLPVQPCTNQALPRKGCGIRPFTETKEITMSVNLGAPEDFSADEQATLARLIAEDRANGDTDEIVDPSTLVPPPAPVVAPVAPPVVAAPAPTTATSPAPQPANAAPADSPVAPQPQGNVTAALRASRAAERAVREQNAALQAEVERLRAASPTPPAPDTGLTDDELRELQADIPAVGKLAEHVRKLSQDLADARAQAQAPAPKPTPGFVPPIQDDPDVQGAIDENPDALAWQHNPDQTGWNYLVAQENMLQSSPVWGPKPLAERLAEAARRVRAELPSSAPTPAQVAAQAAAAAAAAAARAPNTLSDITGGGSPKTPMPGVEQFMKMSDDDIFRTLEASGGG